MPLLHTIAVRPQVLVRMNVSLYLSFPFPPFPVLPYSDAAPSADRADEHAACDNGDKGFSRRHCSTAVAIITALGATTGILLARRRKVRRLQTNARCSFTRRTRGCSCCNA